jgi:hypothetical protein
MAALELDSSLHEASRRVYNITNDGGSTSPLLEVFLVVGTLQNYLWCILHLPELLLFLSSPQLPDHTRGPESEY